MLYLLCCKVRPSYTVHSALTSTPRPCSNYCCASSWSALRGQVVVCRWWWWWLFGLLSDLSWSESRAEGKHTDVWHQHSSPAVKGPQPCTGMYSVLLQPAYSDHKVATSLIKDNCDLWVSQLATVSILHSQGCDGTEVGIDLPVWPGRTQGETSSWLHTAPWVKYFDWEE